MPRDLLITGCSQLVTLRGVAPRRGRALSELGIIPDGALLIRDGRVAAAGPRRAIERQAAVKRASRLDAGGRVVLPGFVDSHTHLVVPSSRADEYEDRIAGASYERIAKGGPWSADETTRLHDTWIGYLWQVRDLRGLRVAVDRWLATRPGPS